MKLNIPVDSIEAKYLAPDVRKKINGIGTEQIINNYVTNTQITNINGGIKAKCISLTNISLNNTTTIIDDYTLIENDIILVAGQTDKTENGLYRYDTNFIRYDFEAGDLIAILNGTNYANSLWKNINNEIVIGTTLIDFGQIHIINVLNDIGDVNIDTPVNNEVLTYKDGEWVNLEISGLPAGTENQTLRHDGTDWVANSLFEINETSKRFYWYEDKELDSNNKLIWGGDVAGMYTTFHVRRQANTKYIQLYAGDTVSQIEMNGASSEVRLYATTNNIINLISGTNKEIRIHDGSNYFSIRNYLSGLLTVDYITTKLIRIGLGQIVLGRVEANQFNIRTNGDQNISFNRNNDAIMQVADGGGLKRIDIGNAAAGFLLTRFYTNVRFTLATANTLVYLDSNKDIKSISDGTNGQFLKTNGAGTYSFGSPNLIKTTTADLTVLTGTASWVDIPLLTVMLEPSVTYELQIMLAIEGAPGRAFKLRLNTAAATYVYRPFVKNTSGVGTDVVYVEDGSSAIPQILDNETEINLTTGNTYHYVEMKGILTTTNNIPNAKLQIYNDSLFGITVKAYSYLKLSR